jgi:hypothetical protein
VTARYWAFRDVNFEHEGYYPPDLYKALWNSVSDRRFAVTEWRYAHGYYGEANAAVGVWICTKEIEKKYALGGIELRWKLIWSPAPKPGAQGENPPQVPKGSAFVSMSGYVVTDYLGTWSKSPILRPLFPLRDRYLYRRRRLVHIKAIRQDAEQIVKDLQEFVSFLPTVR